MDKFSENLNRVSPRKITINEYLPHNDNPNDAFKKMIESGVKCDGLVISGHHTGAFGGARAAGSLGLDFMEKLRCDPKYQSFFENIQAVWLQGCRTLGVNVVTNQLEEDELEEEQLNADFQMFRVGNVLAEDHLEQGISELGLEFSATLDQDNPLSSRYLKLFPRANVFGWTKTAPGVISKSEYSIPYHIAHISKLLDDRKEYFEDPIDEELSDFAAARYAKILLDLLNTNNQDTAPCRLSDGETAVEGWINHGSYSKHGLPFSFDNADLMAYSSLFKSDNPLLSKSREIDCLFKKKLSRDELDNLLNIVLTDERLLGYSFNSIHALVNNFIYSNPEMLEFLREKLNSSEVFLHFLQRKMASNQSSLIKKVEYFDLLKKVTGEEYLSLQKTITKKAFEHLDIPLNSSEDYDLIDYKHTLLEAMGSHGLLTSEFVKKSIKLENLSLRAKAMLYSYIVSEKQESRIPEIEESLKKDLLNLARTSKTNINLDNATQVQMERLQRVRISQKMILRAFKDAKIIDLQFVNELIKEKPDSIFKMSLAETLPKTMEADTRLAVSRKLLSDETSMNSKYSITEALFESFEEAENINASLLLEYKNLAKETNTEFYLNSALTDIFASLEHSNDLDTLIRTYAENRKGHNFTSRGVALKYVIDRVDDRELQKEYIELLLESKEDCDNECLLKLTVNSSNGIKILDTSDRVADYIMESIQSWYKDKFLESVSTSWNNNKLPERSIERLLKRVNFSNIEDRNHHKYLNLLSQIEQRPIDKELNDIIHSDSCRNYCKREALNILAKSPYSSPLAYSMLDKIIEESTSGHELREVLDTINKFQYEIPRLNEIMDKILVKANQDDPNYTPFKDEINFKLRKQQELSLLDRFLLIFE